MLRLYFTVSDAMHMRAYGQAYSPVNVFLFKLCYLPTVQCLLVESVWVCACWTYCLIFYFYVDYQVHFQSSYFFCHKFSLERRLGVLYLDKNISTSICSLLAICYLQLFYEFFLMFNLGKDEPSTFPTSKTWWRCYYLLHKWYHRYSKGKSSIHLIIIRLLLHQ